MGQGPSGFTATNLADVPAAKGELTELAGRLGAALAVDAIPWRNIGPPSVANSAMVARIQRIFFMDTPLPLARKQAKFVSLSRAVAGDCVRSWIGLSRSTYRGSVRGKARQKNRRKGTLRAHLDAGKRTF